MYLPPNSWAEPDVPAIATEGPTTTDTRFFSTPKRIDRFSRPRLVCGGLPGEDGFGFLEIEREAVVRT